MLKRFRWWLVAACGVALPGCSDTGVATGPAPSARPDQPVYAVECDPSAPCFNRIEDVPQEWSPKIRDVSPVVYWEGDRAVGSSLMRYFGNRAREEFELVISGPSTASRTAESSSNGSFLPKENQHTTPGFRLTAPAGRCGHLAQLTSKHFAMTTVWIVWRGFGELTASVSGGDDERQPDCGCDTRSPGEATESVGSNFGPALSCDGDGGGGGGDGMLRCYTITTTYYWYYPETGELVYRYTETSTWCESMS